MRVGAALWLIEKSTYEAPSSGVPASELVVSSAVVQLVGRLGPDEDRLDPLEALVAARVVAKASSPAMISSGRLTSCAVLVVVLDLVRERLPAGLVLAQEQGVDQSVGVAVAPPDRQEWLIG